MSPRKTRRGAKSEGANETLSESIATKMEEGTPAESQRITRTRRRLTKVNSADSDVAETPEVNKSKRKIVQETPSSKTTRSRKKPPLENTFDDSSAPAIIPPRRTRRAKENDTLPEQATLLDSTTANDSGAEKSSRFRCGTKWRTKAVKKSNSKSEDECAEADKINASEAKNVTIIDNMVEDVTSSDAAAPMSIEDDEVHRASIIISRFKAATATPGKRRQRIAKSPHGEFTPESSPITVNLTPHRTTKTPRKSPMNLGSPKSHETSLRLSKTPRKLPIVAESPIPSEKSVTSSTQSTPEKSAESQDGSGSKKKRKKLRSPKDHRKSSSKVVAVRKFSKSPKIVLRSPKAKSPRVPASKLKKPTISKRSTKSPVKSNKSPSIGSVGEKSLSPKKSRGSLSPKISRGSLSPKISRGSLSPKKPRGSLSPKKSRGSLSPKKSRASSSPKKSRASSNPKKSKESLSPKKSRESLSPKKSRESLSPKKSRESVSPKAPVKLTGAAKLFDSPGTRMSLHLSRIDSPAQVPKSPTGSRNSSLTVQTAKQLVQLPTVVLNKISPSSVATPETVTRSRRNTPMEDSSKSTPVVTLVVEKLPHHAAENPRRAKLVGSKRAPITDLGTPLRPIGTPRGSAGKSVILSSSSTPVEISRAKIGSGGPMLSSTPRERIRRSLNLSPGLGLTLGLADSPLNGAAPVESSAMIDEGRGKRRSFRIEDESNPLISGDESAMENPSDDKSRLNGTYEVEGTIIAENEVEHAGNGTYELAEPKTPNLRRKGAKRSLGEMDTSAEERAVKRTCRVRFASPSLDDGVNKEVASVVGRSRSATPGYRVGQKLDGGRRVSGNDTAGSDKFRRRSNSVTNMSLTKTPIAKRRSNSVADGSLRSARIKEQNASSTRLSKPRLSVTSSTKKQEVKTPVAKKAPNFAQIHQKKFAKMESIVDAKKRVEKRHIAMTSQIPTILPKVNNEAPPKPTVPAKATSPRTAVNGAYNRYGFKLRKNDAVKLMTQKQPTNKSEKKLTENRMLLKGVRTNRRFDLIMKARNIKL